jgi:ABC-2 type transport system ATP-binding protein
VTQAPLRVESFGRRYGSRVRWAARKISFELSPGSITALVGPNGAGKSTLIRACVGFERPDEGRVLVSGIDPARHRAAAIDKVGYVPQAAALYRSLSIADHFDIARQARPTFDRGYATQHVRAAGLELARKVGDLSGGEQAQVSLALALGTRAKILLLDEPLASLDPLARRDFLTRLAADVKERGSSAVLSSHIVTDVEQACDRLIVLADGTLELDARIVEVKATFRTMSTADLGALDPVGIFAGPSGESVAVTVGVTEGRPASLEEVVLAHLARARTLRERTAI